LMSTGADQEEEVVRVTASVMDGNGIHLMSTGADQKEEVVSLIEGHLLVQESTLELY
jgi:hypothetical protein